MKKNKQPITETTAARSAEHSAHIKPLKPITEAESDNATAVVAWEKLGQIVNHEEAIDQDLVFLRTLARPGSPLQVALDALIDPLDALGESRKSVAAVVRSMLTNQPSEQPPPAPISSAPLGEKFSKVADEAMQLEAEANWCECGITGIEAILDNLRAGVDGSNELDAINFIATEVSGKIRNLSKLAAQHRLEVCHILLGCPAPASAPANNATPETTGQPSPRSAISSCVA